MAELACEMGVLLQRDSVYASEEPPLPSARGYGIIHGNRDPVARGSRLWHNLRQRQSGGPRLGGGVSHSGTGSEWLNQLSPGMRRNAADPGWLVRHLREKRQVYRCRGREHTGLPSTYRGESKLKGAGGENIQACRAPIGAKANLKVPEERTYRLAEHL